MRFDVFVSFRGIDTRRTFVSHLLLSLFKKQIPTFNHDHQEPKYQSLYSEVRQAIESSRVAIVVISKNYVASRWCLNELAMISNCKKRGSLKVVPVFYEVDPSDVLRQVVDLWEHGDGDNNLEMVRRWKDALEKLIEIYHQKFSSWEDEDSDSDIIDKVLIYVSHCLSGPETLNLHGDKGNKGRLIRRRPRRRWPKFVSPKPPECASPAPPECASPAPPECASPAPPGYHLAGSKKRYTFVHILQCLSVIGTLGIKLVAAALRMIIGRFMYGEDSTGVKPTPLGSLVDMQNNNYVIGNNLSRLLLSNDFNSFVGMDRLMKEMYTLLDLESKDASLDIGISGKSGVGKTTLARCVYEQISPQFQDHHYFIYDTKNCCPGASLLHDIARASLTEESESLDEVVKAKLGHRKVLLIVDNISTGCQAEYIRNIARWFGPGSRLILVTHHKHLLHGMERCYVVEPLRYHEALQLFSQSAFKQEKVPREYYQLSVRAITITGRIPLALKVFGNFLCGKHISEWESELCRFEISGRRCDYVAKVSTYIGRNLS